MLTCPADAPAPGAVPSVSVRMPTPPPVAAMLGHVSAPVSSMAHEDDWEPRLVPSARSTELSVPNVLAAVTAVAPPPPPCCTHVFVDSQRYQRWPVVASVSM